MRVRRYPSAMPSRRPRRSGRRRHSAAGLLGALLTIAVPLHADVPTAAERRAASGGGHAEVAGGAPALGSVTAAATGAPTADGSGSISADTRAFREAMPPAKAGMCYARVEVPAEWRIEPVEIVRREASARFRITPAELAPRPRRVVTREASSELHAVQPVLERERHYHPVRPATTRWVRDGLDGTRPLGIGDRHDLLAAGIDMDAVAPGTCLVEHYRPARHASTSARVLAREASEQLAVQPARFETVERPLVLRPAHARLIEVPPVWREGTQRVMVQPAGVAWKPGGAPLERLDASIGEIMCRVDVPAVYETRSLVGVEQEPMVTRVREPAVVETLEVERLASDAIGVREPLPAAYATIEIPHVEKPGGYFWRVEGATSALELATGAATADTPALGAALNGSFRTASNGSSGAASGGSSGPGGGASFAAAADRGTPGEPDPWTASQPTAGPTGRRLCHREMPPETVAYERLVVREEGRFERRRRPARHTTRTVEVLLADARSERIPLPAVVETVQRRVRTREAGVEWRPVLCETNVTPPVVLRVQRALAREGFSPGEIDGVLGDATLEAVERYQRAHDLARGGLTLETVEALGISL